MSVTQGEKGRPIRLSTGGFDMSGSTGLTLILTKPDGTTLTKTEASANPVTAPAAALTVADDPDIGPQSASTYFEFTSVVADFDQPGIWTICGVYADATKIYHTEAPAKEFTVLEACA